MITVAKRHQKRTRKQRLAMTTELLKPEPRSTVALICIDSDYFHAYKTNGHWETYPIDTATSLMLDMLIPEADVVVTRVLNKSPHIQLRFYR